jgi:hypothetical protein
MLLAALQVVQVNLVGKKIWPVFHVCDLDEDDAPKSEAFQVVVGPEPMILPWGDP